MNPEIKWLLINVLLAALMIIPYVIHRVLKKGLLPAMTYRTDLPPESAWAQRAKLGHANAVENLVLLTPIVLAHQALGQDLDLVPYLQFYTGCRIIHYLSYTCAIPYLRSIVFFPAYILTLVMIVKVLSLA